MRSPYKASALLALLSAMALAPHYVAAHGSLFSPRPRNWLTNSQWTGVAPWYTYSRDSAGNPIIRDPGINGVENFGNGHGGGSASGPKPLAGPGALLSASVTPAAHDNQQSASLYMCTLCHHPWWMCIAQQGQLQHYHCVSWSTLLWITGNLVVPSTLPAWTYACQPSAHIAAKLLALWRSYTDLDIEVARQESPSMPQGFASALPLPYMLLQAYAEIPTSITQQATSQAWPACQSKQPTHKAR
jgi:hypothetical protein